MTASGQTLPGLEQQATAFKAEYENSWSFLSGDQQRVFRLRVAEARTRAAAFGNRLVGILGTTSDPARRGVILKMLERVNKVHAVLTQLHKAVQRIGFGQNESGEADSHAMPRQANRQRTRQNRQPAPAARSRARPSREKRITTAAFAAARRGVAVGLARASFAPPVLAEFETLAEGDGKPSAIAEVRSKFQRLLYGNIGQALVRAGMAFARNPTTLQSAAINAIVSLGVDAANNAAKAMSPEAAEQMKPAVAAAVKAAVPLIEAAARSSDGEQEHALGFAPRYRASRA